MAAKNKYLDFKIDMFFKNFYIKNAFKGDILEIPLEVQNVAQKIYENS